jgi:glycine oxidase
VVAPRAGGIHWVGTTVREAGYDVVPLAVAVRSILDLALAILPGLGALELRHVGVGLRPVSADRMPIIGPSALPGLIIATGHGREGINHAPVTADAVVSLALDRAMPAELTPFAPSRFGI